MPEWFIGRNTTNDLYLRLNDKKYAAISGSVGRAIRSPPLRRQGNISLGAINSKPDYDLMREALKRPYARMDGDYSRTG